MQLPRRSIPPISGLIAFEATARYLSFSRAAEHLALSQGAVSKRVRQLESKLGVELISRKCHNLELTRFGERYLPQVREILTRIDRTTRDLLSEFPQADSVAVAADPGFAIGWLLPRLAEFSRSAPNVAVNLSSLMGDARLPDADVDIAIAMRTGAPDAGTKDEAPLFRDRFIAVAGRQAAAGFSDDELLMNHELLRLSTAPYLWDEWLEEYGCQFEPRKGPVYDHCSLALAAAVHGRGIALLPQHLIQDGIRSGRLRQVGSVHASAGSYVMKVSGASSARVGVGKFRDWLVATARRNDLRPVDSIDAAVREIAI